MLLCSSGFGRRGMQRQGCRPALRVLPKQILGFQWLCAHPRHRMLPDTDGTGL